VPIVQPDRPAGGRRTPPSSGKARPSRAKAKAKAPALEGEDLARSLLIQSILTLRELERRASSTRIEAWTGRHLSHLFTAGAGDFHRALYADVEAILWRREVEGERRTSAAIACPRGHGKSTAMVLGVPLMAALEWRSMPHFLDAITGEPAAPYIVIVSDTIDQARARVMDIRDELEANEGLIAAYGNQAPTRQDRRKWTETHLELANGTIIRAMGAGSKVRGLVRKGRRPSLILVDDLENDQAVETEGQRVKLRRWFTRALIPTGVAGRLATIVVGTILHADSLLSRLLSPEDFPGWLKRRYAARYSTAGLPDPEGPIILWPEYWSAESLEIRRREIGSLAFAQEYLNQPIDNETAIFRWEWLQAARNRGQGLGFLYSPPPRIAYDVSISTWDPVELAERAGNSSAYQVLVTAWDLGIVDNEREAMIKDSDFTCGVTVGLTAGDRLQVRRIYRRRGLTPAELRARVIMEQEITGADYVVIERNAAQRIHEIELRAVPGLPIVGHTTTKAKSSLWEGVPGMALAFELGRIDLANATEAERQRIDTLVLEAHGLGREAHDDTVMSLWMAITVIRRWMRHRNQARAKVLGPPPPGFYSDPFPIREREAA
jgi:hypothetical protein